MPDVVIAGGGISGLAVADLLAATDLEVVVYESRARLGGRLESIDVAQGRADLGATWFWPNEARVEALVRRFGLATHDQWSAGDTIVERSGRISRVQGTFSTGGIRFSQGATGLIEGLADGLPYGSVQLATRVERIEQRPNGVRVHTADSASDAQIAVVAVPPSLALARGLIDPGDLPSELAALASAMPVWMGSTTKAVAVYEAPFWRDHGLSGTASCSAGPLFEIHDMSGPDGQPAMLFGFSGTTPTTPILEPAAILAQLAALFGPEAATPVDLVIRDWRRESETTPQTWPPSQRYDLFGSPALAEPAWDGTLYWTTTETSQDFAGHIEGALAAAERTARSILGR